MTATGFDAWPFTVAHFIVMGVFAALVIAGILWGMKLKRRRVRAAEEFDAHREAADAPTAPEDSEAETSAVDAPTPAADPSPATTPPPASEPAPAPAPPPAGDITMLKGLGPKLAATLAGLGITRVDQIAAMGPAELDTLDAQLGTFRGRPARDRWAEQARLLTSGDRAAYEAAFGKLGG